MCISNNMQKTGGNAITSSRNFDDFKVAVFLLYEIKEIINMNALATKNILVKLKGLGMVQSRM